MLSDNKNTYLMSYISHETRKLSDTAALNEESIKRALGPCSFISFYIPYETWLYITITVLWESTDKSSWRVQNNLMLCIVNFFFNNDKTIFVSICHIVTWHKYVAALTISYIGGPRTCNIRWKRAFIYQYIEVETNCPTSSRRHFQMHFLEWKCTNFY